MQVTRAHALAAAQRLETLIAQTTDDLFLNDTLVVARQVFTSQPSAPYQNALARRRNRRTLS